MAYEYMPSSLVVTMSVTCIRRWSWYGLRGAALEPGGKRTISAGQENAALGVYALVTPTRLVEFYAQYACGGPSGWKDCPEMGGGVKPKCLVGRVAPGGAKADQKWTEGELDWVSVIQAPGYPGIW
jgi:hypothetical protein